MSDLPPLPPPLPPGPDGDGTTGATPPATPPAPPAPAVPPAPPAPGQYGGPVGAPPPGSPQFGTPAPSAPQFGTPQYGAPQYGAPQYGSPPPAGTFQPPAAPYAYGQGIPSNVSLASPGKRIGGWLIDWLILVVGLVVVWVIAAILMAGSTTTSASSFGGTRDEMSGAGVAALMIAYGITILVPIAYHITFVALKGQTPGAMAVKVKIVRIEDGQIPGWGGSILRWLPNLVNLLCSIIGLAIWIWALVNLFSNERRQTPFDLAAKTVVIDVA